MQSGRQALRPAAVEPLGGHDEQLADPVQRVAGAAAVAHRVLLHAAADLVHTLVGQSHDMPVVDQQGGVAQVDAHRSRVAAVGVERDDADAGQPRRVTAGQPARHRPRGAVLHDIEQPTGGGVDQPGHEQRGMLPVRGQPGGLIDTQVGHAGQPSRVVDQRSSVVLDRAHGRVPPDAVLPGDLGDRRAITADPAAHRLLRAVGQHRPRRDPRVLLGPGPGRTPALGAPPAAFAPPQPHEPVERRDISHQRVPAALGPRPHAAVAAPAGRIDGLDEDLELAINWLDREHPHARQPEHDNITSTILHDYLKPSSSLALDSCESARASGIHPGTTTGPPVPTS
ncbi:MAG TPA: hypothetical protein VK875_05890 [Euzebyales bacterium]|nr:hypothetical protein [Euzebyales bacterium]